MNLFYTYNVTGSHFFLDADEAHHCLHVLRMKPGDAIHATDGKGTRLEGVLEEVSRHEATALIATRSCSEKRGPARLHIGIAPPKNIDRMEWFLEKATEIGVDEITPLLCDHSERTRVNTARLRKVVLSAMKQSLQDWLPVLNDPVELALFLGKIKEEQKLIAWCETGTEEHLQHLFKKGHDACVIIGPEGDFSPAEIALAKQNGLIAVNLGRNRLRTETAGIVACHTVAMISEQ